MWVAMVGGLANKNSRAQYREINTGQISHMVGALGGGRKIVSISKVVLA